MQAYNMLCNGQQEFPKHRHRLGRMLCFRNHLPPIIQVPDRRRALSRGWRIVGVRHVVSRTSSCAWAAVRMLVGFPFATAPAVVATMAVRVDRYEIQVGGGRENVLICTVCDEGGALTRECGVGAGEL